LYDPKLSQNNKYLEWRVHYWLDWVLEIPDAKLPLLST
jgi:hypothetical protein